MNQIEPDQFFYNNKDKVVRIKCEAGNGTKREGAGFFINSEGLILTVARLVSNREDVRITIRTTPEESPYWLASPIVMGDDCKFGLLKIACSSPFVEFGAPGSNGQQVRTIFHPDKALFYSYNIGQISFDSRSVRALLTLDDDELNTKLEIFRLNENDKIIQLNNIHGGESGQGAPIFDSQQRVIGVYAFIANNYDFAIPIRAEDAMSFIEKYNDNNKRNQRARKKQCIGEGSGSKRSMSKRF